MNKWSKWHPDSPNEMTVSTQEYDPCSQGNPEEMRLYTKQGRYHDQVEEWD